MTGGGAGVVALPTSHACVRGACSTCDVTYVGTASRRRTPRSSMWVVQVLAASQILLHLANLVQLALLACPAGWRRRRARPLPPPPDHVPFYQAMFPTVDDGVLLL